MQSTILASVNGRLGVGGWREHSTVLCHWAETSTQEAETIQVASRCCFPSWDSHPSRLGHSLHLRNKVTHILCFCPRAETAPSLLRRIRQPIQGSLEWQGNQILELKEYLKKSISSQNTAGRMVFWKPNSDLVTFLLTTLHPLGIKPESLLRPSQGLHGLILAASPSSATSFPSLHSSLKGSCCSRLTCPCWRVFVVASALPLVFALLVLSVDSAHRSPPPSGSLWPLI